MAKKLKVVVDAGHGDFDPGGAGNGIVEKNYVLKTAKLVKAILEKEYEDVEVVLTRDDDTYLTLGERARIARNEGADVFLSLHTNAAIAAARGVETFVHDNSTASLPLARKLKDEILDAARTAGSTSDRGVKKANFGVLRGTYKEMLAVLTEMLFVTNRNDAAILTSTGMIEKMAYAHVRAVADEMKLNKSGKTYSNAVSSGGAPSYNGESFADAHSDWWMKERKETRYAQQKLNALDYNAGPEDGILGQQTLNAVRRFQEDQNISYKGAYYYGVPGPETRDALEEATKANMVIVTYDGGLNVRDVPSWDNDDVVGMVEQGEAFTIVDELEVDGTTMYRLKSGLYITGHEHYVEVK